MGEQLLNWVTACAAILGIVGAGAAFALDGVVAAYSVVIGASIAVLNLMALRRIVVRMFAVSDTGGETGRGKATALFLLKFVLVVAVLWFLFKTVEIHAIALLGGLSVLILAVLLGTLFGPPPQGTDQKSAGDDPVGGVTDG